MNYLKDTEEGLSAIPGVRLGKKLTVPLQVHFVTEADLSRTDGSYNSGRIITKETAEGVRWVDGQFFKDADAIPVLQMQEPFSVSAAWGELVGQPGDWLVWYGGADYGIVDSPIFDETYELL